MLDHEPDTNDSNTPTDTSGSTPPPRRRRAATRPAGPPVAAQAATPEPGAEAVRTPVKAATEASATEASATEASATEASATEASATEASAKKTAARKTAAKKTTRTRKTAASAEPVAPEPVAADIPVDGLPVEVASDVAVEAPARPARKAAAKTTRSRTRKTAEPTLDLTELVAEPVLETAAAEPAAAAPTEEASQEPVAKAPAKRAPRKRTSKKAAAAPVEEIATLVDAAPAAEADAVEFVATPAGETEVDVLVAAVESEVLEVEALADDIEDDPIGQALSALAQQVDNGGVDNGGVDNGGEADDEQSDDDDDEGDADAADSDEEPRRRRRRRGGRRRRRGGDDRDADESSDDSADADDDAEPDLAAQGDADETESGLRKTKANRRSRTRQGRDQQDQDQAPQDQPDQDHDSSDQAPQDQHGAEESAADIGDDSDSDGTRRRRRRRRRRGEDAGSSPDDPTDVVVRVREPRSRQKAAQEVTGIEGSTRMEAKRQRRREGREAGRRRAPILSEAEFLARREAVSRKMIIRQNDELSQIAVLEDDVLVEHYVDRDSAASLIGNVYLGRVQNVLPSMEAAFVDIGRGRNAVLYAGEVDWESFGAEGQNRKVEKVLKSGQTILVQVSKDPVGAKGARLTNHVSIPGRYIVYAPGGHLSGISRKLPDVERKRLKDILADLVGETASVIVRTAAEGASEEELVRDVNRLKEQWAEIERKVKAGQAPQLLYGEPDLTVRIVRDLFTEDFSELIISGNGGPNDAYAGVEDYVTRVAPHLQERISKWNPDEDGPDLFSKFRIDEQIAKAVERKVFLPSGGSLIIDRTEAMTVIDVNTGKFTGTGGNLEATVTSNNLEAAEEIVRQLRLRDIGGIIVIDFIDMVLPSNRELLLRRLVECLGRDRTRHQVAEVTSLGLVQMTRKKIGTGLLEAFTTECPHCHGRGSELHEMPIDSQKQADGGARDQRGNRARGPYTGPRPGEVAKGSDNKGSDNKGSDNKGSDKGADSRSDKNSDTQSDNTDSESKGSDADGQASDGQSSGSESRSERRSRDGEGRSGRSRRGGRNRRGGNRGENGSSNEGGNDQSGQSDGGSDQGGSDRGGSDQGGSGQDAQPVS